jgi:hypothetical protein
MDVYDSVVVQVGAAWCAWTPGIDNGLNIPDITGAGAIRIPLAGTDVFAGHADGKTPYARLHNRLEAPSRNDARPNAGTGQRPVQHAKVVDRHIGIGE